MNITTFFHQLWAKILHWLHLDSDADTTNEIQTSIIDTTTVADNSETTTNDENLSLDGLELDAEFDPESDNTEQEEENVAINNEDSIFQIPTEATSVGAETETNRSAQASHDTMSEQTLTEAEHRLSSDSQVLDFNKDASVSNLDIDYFPPKPLPPEALNGATHASDVVNNTPAAVNSPAFVGTDLNPATAAPTPASSAAIWGSKSDDSLSGDLNGIDSNDYINGGKSDDFIYGLNGNDFLVGAEGKDFIYGGEGNDIIFADNAVEGTSLFPGLMDLPVDPFGDEVSHHTWQKGHVEQSSHFNDTVYGGAGDDYIVGGQGDDTLHGGDGDDVIFGGNGIIGNDKNSNGGGNDTLFGDAGNDILYGQKGNDTLYGGDGDDHLYGGDGNDVLYGDAGNDYLDGGKGNDKLYGGEGDDVIHTGAGKNLVNGGAGNDTMFSEGTKTVFEYDADSINGHDVIHGFDNKGNQHDQIDLSALFDSLGVQDKKSVRSELVELNHAEGTNEVVLTVNHAEMQDFSITFVSPDQITDALDFGFTVGGHGADVAVV